MNTKPPGPETSRAVWTVSDEAKMQELIERRGRIMSENRNRVLDLLLGLPDVSMVADVLISNADAVVAALQPFTTQGAKS